MKIKELLGYLGGFIVGFLITTQVIVEFNPDDLVAWLLLFTAVGFDTLILIHFIQRIKAEYDD